MKRGNSVLLLAAWIFRKSRLTLILRQAAHPEALLPLPERRISQPPHRLPASTGLCNMVRDCYLNAVRAVAGNWTLTRRNVAMLSNEQ